MSEPEIRFRPIKETAGDREILYQVYASTRRDEMAQVPWSEAEKQNFLRFQFDAQHKFYQGQFPDAEYSMVLVAGREAGRLYLDRRDDEHRLIDIALLPEYRNKGLGSRLMRGVLSEATAARKRVCIHVEQQNPAMHLYLRLGFKKIEDQGVYDLMEWTPSQLA